MVDLTNVDLTTIASPGALTGWGAGVVSLLASVMALRRKGSNDARDRARNEKEGAKDNAEASYFETALSQSNKERDQWKQQFEESRKNAEEAWTLLRAAEQTIARLTALQEERDKDVAELRAQIGGLHQILLSLAPENLRAILANLPLNALTAQAIKP